MDPNKWAAPVHLNTSSQHPLNTLVSLMSTLGHGLFNPHNSLTKKLWLAPFYGWGKQVNYLGYRHVASGGSGTWTHLPPRERYFRLVCTASPTNISEGGGADGRGVHWKGGSLWGSERGLHSNMLMAGNFTLSCCDIRQLKKHWLWTQLPGLRVSSVIYWSYTLEQVA